MSARTVSAVPLAVAATLVACLGASAIGIAPDPEPANAVTSNGWQVATAPGPAVDWSRPAPPSPCTAHSPHRDCVTAAEARRRIEAAGRSWKDFTATTTIRPRYETVFIRLWLAP